MLFSNPVRARQCVAYVLVHGWLYGHALTLSSQFLTVREGYVVFLSKLSALKFYVCIEIGWIKIKDATLDCSLVGNCSSASVRFAEDDLIIECHRLALIVALVRDLLTEVVQSLDGGFVMIATLVRLPVLFLEVTPISHVVAVQLRQVFGLAVGDGPFVVFGVPFRCFSFFSFLRRLLLGLFLLLVSFGFLWSFYFDFLDDNLLLHVRSDDELSLFLFVLKANNSDDLPDVLFNGEELVHEAKLEPFLVALEFVRVAEAFEQNESLVGAATRNLLLHQLHHKRLVVMHRRELGLIEGIRHFG